MLTQKVIYWLVFRYNVEAMKIKNDNELGITYLLRKIILNNDLKYMVRYLYERRMEKEALSVYLPLANDRMNEIAENPELHDEGFDSCFEKDDSTLINELIRLKVLSRPKEYNFSEDDDGSFIATVKVENPDSVEHFYKWIRGQDYIINYGVFSLHTFTGEAYCMDNRYDFDTSMGLFRVYKAFLEEPTHILSYVQIHNLFHRENITNVSEAKFINQTISEIREKLKMTEALSKLLIPADKKYLLISE